MSLQPPRSRWRIVGRYVLGAAGLAFALLALTQAWYLGWIVYYLEHDPQTTRFMALRRSQGTEIRQQWVPYERISPWIKRCVIAAEDAHFARHNGFDWAALWDALQENLAAERVVRGGSTITQQLAKNLLLSPRQSLIRKGQEALLTIMIESVMPKRRILEIYLNVIEWGDGVFGIAAATRHYYDQPPGQLGRWQAAMLAARIPRPRFYDRVGRTGFLVERAGDIYTWSAEASAP